MGVLDVGHRPRMQIEPLVTKDSVPSPADEEINHDQNPDREMIDLHVGKSLWIILTSEVRLQADCGADRAMQPSPSPLSCPYV